MPKTPTLDDWLAGRDRDADGRPLYSMVPHTELDETEDAELFALPFPSGTRWAGTIFLTKEELEQAEENVYRLTGGRHNGVWQYCQDAVRAAIAQDVGNE